MDPAPLTRASLDALVTELRGELHRYCARMAGSLIDGEDLVQEVLAGAYALLPAAPVIHNPRGWLFRVAHNRAIDHLRRYERGHVEPLGDEPAAAEGGLPLLVAMIVFADRDRARERHAVDHGRVAKILDFRHARALTGEAEISPLTGPA